MKEMPAKKIYQNRNSAQTGQFTEETIKIPQDTGQCLENYRPFVKFYMNSFTLIEVSKAANNRISLAATLARPHWQLWGLEG